MFGYETLKDEKGEEMHKSKGNTIWFDEAVEKIGADPIRLFYCSHDPTLELKFGFNVIKEPQAHLNILFNIGRLISNSKETNKLTIEDRWILSRLNSLIKEVTEELESLHPHKATRAMEDFWLNDLSRGYIKFVRDRIAEDNTVVKYVLKIVYIDLLKLFAPICPFTTEHIWQELKKNKLVKEESVHLCDWPKTDSKKIDKKIEIAFESASKIIEKGLAARDKEQIGLRWPLAKATATITTKLGSADKLNELVARQLNVKEVIFKQGKESTVELDTKLTPELEAEGFAREIARKVQAERKKRGLQKSDFIDIDIAVTGELRKMLTSQLSFLKERTNAKVLNLVDKIENTHTIFSTIKGKKVEFIFK